MPYNENAHLMTAMFRQQLINCETFLHASPSEICLRPTVRQCVCCKRAANEKKEHVREASREEREGEIDERDILLLRHTFRESLCELSRWKAEIYGSALCTSGVCTRKRPSQARVLASTYLHTSGLRKHLLKPTSFQTSRVYFHTDSLPPVREGRSDQTMICSFELSYNLHSSNQIEIIITIGSTSSFILRYFLNRILKSPRLDYKDILPRNVRKKYRTIEFSQDRLFLL